MSIPPEKCEPSAQSADVSRLFLWLRWTVGACRRCGHNTHERVFAATGTGGSDVLLYVGDRDLEYFNSPRPQRAMQGNEEVVGDEKPHHARQCGSARRGRPEGVPGRRRSE